MSSEYMTGLILDEDSLLTLDELSHACRVQADWIIQLVEEGALEPTGQDMTQWVFTGVCIQRVRTARRLQRDLGVNIAGAALVLDLMEEIADLRAQLSVLKQEDI